MHPPFVAYFMKLIVAIIEPFHGRIYDPACGSGGMFVQSARFVAEHQASPGEIVLSEDLGTRGVAEGWLPAESVSPSILPTNEMCPMGYSQSDEGP